jgi:hypothetical protein
MHKHARLEVLTAVVMKSNIFWDITPCSPLKVNRRFGGTYRLHLQGRRKAEQETSVKAEATSVDFQWTTRRYIPEESTPQCINSFTFFYLFNDAVSAAEIEALQSYTS